MGALGQEQVVLKLLEVMTMGLVPMVLDAAVKLGVMDILAEHAGPDGYLSAEQIATHFGTRLATSTSPFKAATSLDRFLRLLACHGILSSSHFSLEGQPTTTSYALNSLSRLLVQAPGGLPSLASYLQLVLHPTHLQASLALHSSLLNGTDSFTIAHGTNLISYAQLNSAFDQVFNNAMASHTSLFMHSFLDIYAGFNDITSLVDVGGGIGASLATIVSKHPHIKGINFDLPHIVVNAPKYQGVEHIGGDMFERVPRGNAIFMKWMLHGWDDVHCIKILKQCKEALPSNGKVILVDYILSDEIKSDDNSRVGYRMDIIMFMNSQRGKERTEKEMQNISKASGFSRLQVICNIHGCSVVELYN